MQYRVMSYDGTTQDFETEVEARILFATKKIAASKAEVVIDKDIEIRPSANIHKCYHDESPPRPCEIIEEYKK